MDILLVLQGHFVLHIYFSYVNTFPVGASCARGIAKKTLTYVSEKSKSEPKTK